MQELTQSEMSVLGKIISGGTEVTCTGNVGDGTFQCTERVTGPIDAAVTTVLVVVGMMTGLPVPKSTVDALLEYGKELENEGQ